MANVGEKFSIVLPVRNGVEYVGNAIASVLSQTDSNFDLIILENCSDDGTQDIIASFNDARIQYRPSSIPLSIENNWHRILNLELGKYLTIIGHDDVLYPDFLEVMGQLIQTYPNASLYHSHFHLIDEDGNQIRECKSIPLHETAEQFLYARHKKDRDTFGTGYVVRSTDFKAIKGFSTNFPGLIGADDITWYRLSKISCKVCSPEFLFAYRFHLSSTSYSIDLVSLVIAFNQYYSMLGQMGYLDNEKNLRATTDFLRKSFTGRHRRILVDLINDSDPSKWEDYRKIKAKLHHDFKADFLKNKPDISTEFLEIIEKLPKSMRKLLVWLIELIGSIKGLTR